MLSVTRSHETACAVSRSPSSLATATLLGVPHRDNSSKDPDIYDLIRSEVQGRIRIVEERPGTSQLTENSLTAFEIDSGEVPRIGIGRTFGFGIGNYCATLSI